MATKTKRGKPSMTDDHKAALALGREQGRSVRQYLEALEQHKPKRGRKRTPDSIKRRLSAIENELEDADALSRVHLIQERMDLENELAAKESTVDLGGLEDSFIKAAKEYGTRKGISYQAWREAGVAPAVLRKAGIGRGQL
ncbi:MAG: hypothetical protein NVS3B12_20370 [Acidimicrobiales bacterium]